MLASIRIANIGTNFQIAMNCVSPLAVNQDIGGGVAHVARLGEEAARPKRLRFKPLKH